MSCFYSTYEELKRYPAVGIDSFDVVFLQYLWGIETILEIDPADGVLSFYSTYEELKHNRQN